MDISSQYTSAMHGRNEYQRVNGGCGGHCHSQGWSRVGTVSTYVSMYRLVKTVRARVCFELWWAIILGELQI
jgi:hypothetical protein